MNRLRFLMLIGSLCLAWGPAAFAQMYSTPTLEKIREFKAIYVGYRETGVPFSYVIDGQPAGFSIELCDRIVDAAKRAIGDPTIQVIRVPVSSMLRFMMLQAGVIDLECGSTTNTKIRQQLASFGVTIFVSGVKGAARSDSSISRIKDLDGKAVITLGGTSTENVVRNGLAARKVSAIQSTVRTYAEALDLVQKGQADVFVTDDALLAGLIASSSAPERFKTLEDNFGFEPYGIGLRKDDPEFKGLVDDTLKGLMASGEFARIYEKWFMSPIPPKGINLKIPMSGLLQELVRNPNDEGN